MSPGVNTSPELGSGAESRDSGSGGEGRVRLPYVPSDTELSEAAGERGRGAASPWYQPPVEVASPGQPTTNSESG